MSDLIAQMHGFAEDIRTDGGVSFSRAPGMAIYRELFFNNVCGFLDGTFPVCREVIGEVKWREICRGYFREHCSQSPLFLEIPEELLNWLVGQGELLTSVPFMAELAHYEWLELAIDIMDVELPDAATDDREGVVDLLAKPIEVNPALISVCYKYPVHKYSADEPEHSPETSAFIVYRDANDKVRFVSCTPVSILLLAELQATGDDLNGRDVITRVLDAQGITGDAAFHGAADLLSQWHQQDILFCSAL
ncbi:MAG: putative DNA-binding domain-containing protein [Thalassolituus sp.]